VLLRVDSTGWPHADLSNELALQRVALRAALVRADRAEARVVRLNRRASAAEQIISGDWQRAVVARDEVAATKQALDAVATERDHLRKRLRDAEIEVAQLRESTRYQLGATLIGVTERPQRLRSLPRDLKRVWRARGAWRSGTSVASLDQAAAAAEHGHPDDRLLSAFRQLPAADATVVFGAFSRATVEQIGSAAAIVDVAPHEALAVLDRIEPTVLVVESASALAGEQWSSLGSAIGARNEGIMISMIDECQRRGLPTVFWWTTAPSLAPGLARLARRCDIIASDPTVDGVPVAHVLTGGIQLASLEPRPPTWQADGRPLLHLPRSRVRKPVGIDEALLKAALRRGLEVLCDPSIDAEYPMLRPANVRDRYRSAPWALAAVSSGLGAGEVPERTLRLLANGVPVVAARNAIPPELREFVHTAVRSDDVDVVLDAAATTPLEASQIRHLLRMVWHHGSFEHELARAIASDTPIDEHRTQSGVAVVVPGDVDGTQVVEQLVRQSNLPATVVAPVPSALDGVRGELVELGIEVVSTPGAATEHEVCWDAIARWNEHTVLDLVIAAEVNGGRSIDNGDVRVLTTARSSNDRAVGLPWWLEDGGGR
jgi:hypothetical protein